MAFEYAPAPESRAVARITSTNDLFIDGEFVDAAQGGRIPVLNPHDNSTLIEIAEATVVSAVSAGRQTSRLGIKRKDAACSID